MLPSSDFVCIVLIKSDVTLNGFDEEIFFINGDINFAYEKAEYFLSLFPEGCSYSLYKLIDK